MIKVFRYKLNGYQTTRPHIISFFLYFFCAKGMFLTFLQNVRTFGYHTKNIWFYIYRRPKIAYVHIKIQRMQKKYFRCSRTSHYMNKYKRRIMSSRRQWLGTSQKAVVVSILQLF